MSFIENLPTIITNCATLSGLIFFLGGAAYCLYWFFRLIIELYIALADRIILVFKANENIMQYIKHRKDFHRWLNTEKAAADKVEAEEYARLKEHYSHER